MKSVFLVVFLSLSPSAKASGYSIGYMIPDRFQEYFPKDLANFLEKKRECVHWGGEVGGPMDNERLNSLKQGMKGCDQLEKRQKQLESKYASKPIYTDMRTTIAEIDRGEDIDFAFLWKDPERKSKVLTRYITEMAEDTAENVTNYMKDYDDLLRKDPVQLGWTPHFLATQWDSLQVVLGERDRLPLRLREKIEALSNDRVFADRVEAYRRR